MVGHEAGDKDDLGRSGRLEVDGAALEPGHGAFVLQPARLQILVSNGRRHARKAVIRAEELPRIRAKRLCAALAGHGQPRMAAAGCGLVLAR